MFVSSSCTALSALGLEDGRGRLFCAFGTPYRSGCAPESALCARAPSPRSCQPLSGRIPFVYDNERPENKMIPPSSKRGQDRLAKRKFRHDRPISLVPEPAAITGQTDPPAHRSERCPRPVSSSPIFRPPCLIGKQSFPDYFSPQAKPARNHFAPPAFQRSSKPPQSLVP